MRWCRRCCARFGPEVLVSQHGCDTHWQDPLAGLRLSIDAQRAASAAIQNWPSGAGGRWLLTGGGGYELLRSSQDVGAPAGEAAGIRSIPGPIPAAWREYAARGAGRLAPEFMPKGPRRDTPARIGYDRQTPSTGHPGHQAAVFPEHG